MPISNHSDFSVLSSAHWFWPVFGVFMLHAPWWVTFGYALCLLDFWTKIQGISSTWETLFSQKRKNTALKSFAWKWCISFWLAKPVMWLRLITIGGRVLSSQRKRVVNNWKHGNNTTVCKSWGWTSFYKFYIGF